MKMSTINSILLRRRNKLLLTEGSDSLPAEYAATFLKNIEPLGYTFSPEAIRVLLTQNETELKALQAGVVQALKTSLGAHVEHEPMYPNFPEQVMDASDAELYINAIMHYLGDALGLRIMPVYEKAERAPLDLQADLKVIELGTEDELADIAKALIGANTSVSETDKDDVKVLVYYFRDSIKRVLPAEIPNKENLAFATSLMLDNDLASDVLLTAYYKTATDVLRLATALSEGDVSLAANTKFKSFKRSERRLLLSLLDRIKYPLEDMSRHTGRWIRLGERLHPGEYKSKYPNANDAFQFFRDGKKFRTFNSKVEAALAAGDTDTAIELLKARPGELSRRLDHLMRLGAVDGALEAFAGVAEKVSTPVLLQLFTHFKHRDNPPEVRTVFPKGSVGKVMALPNDLPELPEGAASRVQETCREALVKRFSEMDSLGRVYISPELERYNVPFSQRSASKALRTLVRGSRVPLGDGSTVRLFLWWKEGKVGGANTGRVDIDLSAVMYDENWHYKEHISYTNLKSAKYQAAHSGDITSAPNGACEFIDLDVESVVKYGGRYVVMNALSFTRQAFVTMPECFVGWMNRSKPQSGEVFEPRTVANKVDLSADTKICIPAIFDMKERQVIWCDIGLKASPRWVNVEENRTSIVQMGKALTTMRKTTLLDLFTLHATARGELVDSPEDADTVFSPDEGVTPFELERIMSEFLA